MGMVFVGRDQWVVGGGGRHVGAWSFLADHALRGGRSRLWSVVVWRGRDGGEATRSEAKLRVWTGLACKLCQLRIVNRGGVKGLLQWQSSVPVCLQSRPGQSINEYHLSAGK